MTSLRTRSTIALFAAVTGLMACSSDDTLSVTTTPEATAAPLTNAATDPTEAPIETDAPSSTAIVTTAATKTTVEDTTDSIETTVEDTPVESTVGDTTVGVGAKVDDTPVCKAFSRVLTTSFFVGFAGSGAESTDSGIERVEIVAYSSLSADVATLREDVPAELLPGLEPLLDRIDAAPAALASGGFDAAEIATIASAWNTVLDAVYAGQSLADIPDATESLDQAKLGAAEVAFEGAVGTFADYKVAADGSDEFEDEGNAWLAENCPILASSLDG